MPTIFLSNSAHYARVLAHCTDVRHTLWIGTADIKDAYIEQDGVKMPFLKLLAQLVRRGVAIRLIHAKEPGPAFREDFDKYPSLINGMERALCPRVHFKMFVFDCKEVYVGSANLTGASDVYVAFPHKNVKNRIVFPMKIVVQYSKLPHKNVDYLF